MKMPNLNLNEIHLNTGMENKMENKGSNPLMSIFLYLALLQINLGNTKISPENVWKFKESNPG